ncbi:hypothetical protein [Paenibacillus dendritiformis]|uniref:hypothetical protein n=1 Tax=Paenibacillus dendritiformis TaxID=130049 RepID=UPI001C657621|nr:hypothetical protein [Paenibacillus dendritiformis]
MEKFRGALPNPDDLKDMLARVMRLLARQGLSDKELVLTEWNPTAYHRELTNMEL